MRSGNIYHFEQVALPDANVLYAPDFFSLEDSNRYLKVLQEEINWKQESIKLFGKEQPMPRLTAWYGDKAYTYSGLQNKPQPWSPALLEIRDRVTAASGKIFNSVLLNLYRSGQDSMGWHADNEPELGKEPCIASVSFGAVRRFGFRHRFNKALENKYITLQHGSLLLMQGPTQHYWHHSIPKTTKELGLRINLTFRYVVS